MKEIMKWLMFAVAAVCGVAALAALGHAQQRAPRPSTIYGDDDRLDVYQVKNPVLKKLEASTVGLFHDWGVTVDPMSGKAKLATSSYSEEYNLCKDEPFYDQRTGAFCSGSLVAPDIIMTAGHCVTSQEACVGTKFVFGFSIYNAKSGTPEQVTGSDVYGCKELIGREQEGQGADWALVRLDRPVTDRKPLEISRSGSISKGTPLFVIGHPAGLPTKIAGGAKVRDDQTKGYFVANLDTYGGNSGSAVFNALTGLVEGILVRGENDYVYRDGAGCRVSNRCPNDGCRGEDVTRVAEVASKIPAADEGDDGAKIGPVAVLPSASGGSLRRLREGLNFDGALNRQ
jgi:V8-like Glu-specific endopeptidase